MDSNSDRLYREMAPDRDQVPAHLAGAADRVLGDSDEVQVTDETEDGKRLLAFSARQREVKAKAKRRKSRKQAKKSNRKNRHRRAR